MIRVIFTILYVAIFSLANAQINIEPDTTILQDSVVVEEDSVVVTVWKRFDVQPHVGLTYEISPNPDGYFESLSGEVGVVYKNHWFVSLFATQYQGEYLETVVFPNRFSLKYKHGGINVGYKTDLEKRIDLMVGAKTSWGTMLWEYADSGRDFIKDNVTIINPFIGVDFNINRFLKFNVGLGYRKLIDLDLASLDSSDFDGFAGNVSLKLGRFNYMKK